MSLAKRPWTEEDNARLKEFVAQGASIIRAAAALHRNIKSVRIQARKVGEPFPPMRVFRKKKACKCDLQFLAPVLALIPLIH